MTTITEIQTTQVYQVFIKATPEQIWDAITKPEFTQATSTAPATTSTPDRLLVARPERRRLGRRGRARVRPAAASSCTAGARSTDAELAAEERRAA